MGSIDLNCDMGEGFGRYSLGEDEALLPYLSAVNIACGFHAGDPAVMRKTVVRALAHGVSIGAHPGLPDLQGFGRRNLHISPEQAFEMVLYQLGALWAIVKAEGGTISHVKPHGALYNMAAEKQELAEAIAKAVQRFDPELILYGLAGSQLIKAGEQLKLKTASEAFADRSYEQNGTLTHRSLPGAVLTDPVQAARQALQLAKHGTVISRQGIPLSLRADTICIHGDNPNALAFVQSICETLDSEGISIRALR